jgi:hypothetical protein
VIDATRHVQQPRTFSVTALGFGHLGCHFMKPGDLEDISCQQDAALCSQCDTAEQMS